VCVCVCVCSKQAVVSDAKYCFLRGLVANVPDIHSTEDNKDMIQQHQPARREVTGGRLRGRFDILMSHRLSTTPGNLLEFEIQPGNPRNLLEFSRPSWKLFC